MSSNETSSERAECVSAPTEISSTPVSAIARIVSRLTPPEASSRARPAVSATASRSSVERHVVEEDRVDAGLERLCDLAERVALDLDRKVAGRADEPDSIRDGAGRTQVVVLDEDGVVEPEAMVAAPAARDCVLLERAEPRAGLARVEHGGARAVHGGDVVLREGRNARQATEEVQRNPLTGEDRALRAADAGDDRRRLVDRVTVARERLEADLRVESAERRLCGAEPADDTRLLHEELGRPHRFFRHRCFGGHVAGADVLGQRGEHRALERVGGYSHGSSTGASPDRRTTCRSKDSLSAG